MGGEPPPGYSSGGMRTKLVAARIATRAGCAMAIAIGNVERPLQALERGARCTWFLPAPEGRTARKRWIAGSLPPLGVLTVDAGAARALANGRSLLPAGVRAVEGTFDRGDPVTIAGPDGAVLGARPVGLCQRRRRAHRRPPLRRDRGDPGLARPRRDDPSRRSGAGIATFPSWPGGRPGHDDAEQSARFP